MNTTQVKASSTATRKVKTGVVISRKSNKTAMVKVERLTLNPIFKKYVKQATIFKVHDEKNETSVGDTINIAEGRPVSKDKRWRLVKVLSKGELAEI